MNGKKKFLILGLLLLALMSFFLGDFWSWAVYALENALAAKVLSLVLSKILAGTAAVAFLL